MWRMFRLLTVTLTEVNKWLYLMSAMIFLVPEVNCHEIWRCMYSRTVCAWRFSILIEWMKSDDKSDKSYIVTRCEQFKCESNLFCAEKEHTQAVHRTENAECACVKARSLTPFDGSAWPISSPPMKHWFQCGFMLFRELGISFLILPFPVWQWDSISADYMCCMLKILLNCVHI